MKPVDSFTKTDMIKWYGMSTVLKGEGYVEAVTDLAMLDDAVSAEVSGNETRPYRVHIDITRKGRGNWTFPSRCSCPVGGFCKHATAVLLLVLELRDSPDNAVSPAVLAWIEALQQTTGSTAAATAKKRSAASSEQLFYLLNWQGHTGAVRVDLLKGRLGKDGLPADTATHWSNVERALLQPPKFVSDEDLAILRLLWAMRRRDSYYSSFDLQGTGADDVLRRMQDTGRLYAGEGLHPLLAGEARAGELIWQPDDTGRLVLRLKVAGASRLISSAEPVWYLDLEAEQAGPVALDLPPRLVRQLLSVPALSATEMPVVAAALTEYVPIAPRPSQDITARLRVITADPQPLLRLATTSAFANYGYRSYPRSYTLHDFDYAVPWFRYDDVVLKPGDKREFITLPGGETVRLKHQPEREAEALKALTKAGFKPAPNHLFSSLGSLPADMYGLESEQAWTSFMQTGLPHLREAGWALEYSANFRHNVLSVDDWQADITETENGWFDLDMGIVVEGQRLPLAPLLANLFHRDPRWLDLTQVAQIADDEQLQLNTPDGRRLAIPAERIKPLAQTLIELFDSHSEDTLRLSPLDAPRLDELSRMARWQFNGVDAVHALAERLRLAEGVRPIEPPRGFALELRSYQREGLAWLQYLREHNLAGILADDMGLGKTAQTLAHLLLEKEAGRLDRPALVVLPTSLIFNWQREAARFAPALKVLSLQGPTRKERINEITQHDVVLTTYPLLWRDDKDLCKHQYHLLILDEAQTVKNARSRAADVVRRLDARHRLCLTGTPLENHLGELWSQFDFLLPGFLGDSKQFTRTWRTPIEKHGDQGRRALLASRIKPFILRRRKQDVAKELPPKTIILRTVELEGAQRDLYETVRATVDAKLREEIASKGFNRSQIALLDALLKLRQVCCDPRLVKSQAAKQVTERAKLQQLMDMVPELVEEGRRILVFSQFTAMLSLIEDELKRIKLPYVLLTGDTTDRETPIRRFQDGEVPIFLISLKAGGVGLNLTAADTVIHYDPWWNPAVENQATDRAHRLGQDKPVFVYKLIVAGSIEERILALQEKKASLAEGILSNDSSAVKFTESDLAALLAPLP